MQGQTFDQVLHHVHSRAARMLPDAVVRTADLRMDKDGRMSAAGSPTWRLNDWSQRQLASLLGIRWGKWFETTSGEERAEEVNRRLSRIPGEKKVRAWRDDTGEANGIARSFMAPAFTPIDDARIFDRMDKTMRPALGDYRFTRVELTDTTTQYAVQRTEPVDIEGDVFFPGWTLRNSEVGAGPFTLDDFWLRQICTNGMTVKVGGKHLLYRTHRQIDDDQLSAGIVVALARLPERWEETTKLLTGAKKTPISAPDVEVEHALAGIPRALVEEAQTEALKDGERTRFGVVQAITRIAHTTNTDPEIRFRMEQMAGEYLAAA